ncbi:sigma-70 family RNA polymerase sigma factor [bacterium]|nr:sigma-70 family RNA polymerase sigma factor [bacterium]
MIQDGDSLALDIIYKKYINLIYKKIKEFNFKSDYEDILQECLIVLNNSIEKYKDGPVPFVAFFSRNLQNKLSSIYTTKKKNKLLVSDSVGVMMDSSFSFFADYDINEKLFKGLTPLERKLIELRFLEKKEVSFILKNYEMKRSTYYYIVKKALNTIRKNITKYQLSF